MQPTRLILYLLLTAPLGLRAASNGVPTPESVFGFAPGADYKLATYDQSGDYFRKVGAASRNAKLVDIGKTTHGRPMLFALVSSPANLAKIDPYRHTPPLLPHPPAISYPSPPP